MDPLTFIASALALGAAAGLKDGAAQAVKDAYAGLKGALTRKFQTVSLERLEQAPESKPQQAVVAEDLGKAGAADDHELLELASALIKAIEAHAPGAAAAVGVVIDDLKAASLTIGDVRSAGGGVVIKGSEIAGDVRVGDVTAGVRGSDPKA